MNMSENIAKDQNNKTNINQNNYNNIDERINKVCENAELEYSRSHGKNKTNNPNNNINDNNENGMSIINNSNYYINNDKRNYLKREQMKNENNDDNRNNINTNQSYSNIAKINNKSLDTDANVLSKIKLGLQQNNKSLNNKNYNNINSPFNKGSDNYNKKIALYNLNQKDNKKIKNNANNIKETKIKSDLSKILLESRDLIKKVKIKEAYILLRKTILTGIQHSDLFYLYGEVNRLINQYKTAEDYLLKAVKFELHSPYAFYSLGLLYQDLKEYQNSNKFFKLFYRLMDNGDLHFQMGINYFYMKDFVNAAEELTKAIEINNECAEYYQFRSEIYKKMGLKEMENEDFKMYWFITQKKREDEE